LIEEETPAIEDEFILSPTRLQKATMAALSEARVAIILSRKATFPAW